jgi:hypothetical protein
LTQATTTKSGGRRKSAFSEEEEGYMFVEEGFRIRFANGEVIDFYADTAKDKEGWMKVLSEAVGSGKGSDGGSGKIRPWCEVILEKERKERLANPSSRSSQIASASSQTQPPQQSHAVPMQPLQQQMRQQQMQQPHSPQRQQPTYQPHPAMSQIQKAQLLAQQQPHILKENANPKTGGQHARGAKSVPNSPIKQQQAYRPNSAGDAPPPAPLAKDERYGAKSPEATRRSVVNPGRRQAVKSMIF